MLASILRAGRAAHGCRRQHRAPASSTRSSETRAVRRPRRRTLQLPAALGAFAARPLRRRAQRRPDHLDWHGSMAGVRRRQGPYLRGHQAAPASTTWPTRPPRTWCARPTSGGLPGDRLHARHARPRQLGVVDGILVDRAFVENRHKQAQELAEVADVARPPRTTSPTRSRRRRWPVPTASHRRRTRRTARLPARRAPHRKVAGVDGVAYVDDSKATNTHAARSLPARLRPDRVDRGRAGQGGDLRRARRESARAAARRRTDRGATAP